MKLKWKGRHYEKNPMEMVTAAVAQDSQFFDYFCGKCCCAKITSSSNADEQDDTLDSVFCSELVAHCYQECGIVDRKKKAHFFLPKDFSGDPNSIMDEHIFAEYDFMDEVRAVRKDVWGWAHKFYKFDPNSTYVKEDEDAKNAAAAALCDMAPAESAAAIEMMEAKDTHIPADPNLAFYKAALAEGAKSRQPQPGSL